MLAESLARGLGRELRADVEWHALGVDGSEMIAGSLNRLRRNGCTASGESGPPRLNRTMAIFIA